MSKFSTAFNRLWSASIASNYADGILGIAAPLVAVSLTTAPVTISMMSALGMLPWLLFAIPIGGLADRVNRKKFLATAHIVRALTASAVSFLIASHHLTIALLFLAVLIFGTCEVIADTTAQTLIPQMLEKEELERGNSRLYLAETVIQNFIGNPSGGFFYGIALGLPMLVSGTGYLIAAALIMAIPLHAIHAHKTDEEKAAREPFIEEVKFGIKWLFAHKQIRHLVLMTTSIGFWFNFGNATIILFMLKTLHLKEQYFGLAWSITGIGSVLASLTAAKVSQRIGRGTVMWISMFVQCGIWIVQGTLHSFIPFIALGIFNALLGTYWNILIMSTYQELIPNHLYGRIHGTRRTLVWGMMPFGSLLGGYVSTFGLRIPIIIGGAIGLIITAFNFRFIRGLGKATPSSI